MLKKDCIFCQIVSGEMTSDLIFQDELVSVFRDIKPVAPVHLLIIPNEHIQDANELTEKRASFAARMLTVVPELAKKEGVAESGYRLIMNTGADGRQEIFHLHLHLLGGIQMKHPMG